MLIGPKPIDSIDNFITVKSAGIYILSRDSKTAAYVGRSDHDLASRLKQYSIEEYGYTHFWFEYTSSVKDAYLKECEYYHKYNSPDNKNHPATPEGTNLRCPVSGCPWS